MQVMRSFSAKLGWILTHILKSPCIIHLAGSNAQNCSPVITNVEHEKKCSLMYSNALGSQDELGTGNIAFPRTPKKQYCKLQSTFRFAFPPIC